MLENDKKKLGMDSADPQNRSERTPSRKTCQKAQSSVEENRALKWIYDDIYMFNAVKKYIKLTLNHMGIFFYYLIYQDKI